MKVFKDSHGRDWSIAIDTVTAKRVKALLQFDLFASDIDSLSNNMILLVDVLYVVCKPQADAAGITDEQFGASMTGDVLDAASEALQEDIVDFFPLRRRLLTRKALAKVKAATDEAMPLLEQKMDRDIAAAMASIRGDTSTSKPVLSESIQPT